MRKNSLLISAAIAGLTLVGAASDAKADMIKISAKQACSRSGDLALGGGSFVDVGHVSIAFYDGNGNLLETKGMQTSGVETNNSDDLAMANGKGCGIASRTLIVSSEFRERAQNEIATSGGTNCHQYSYVVRRILGPDQCTCVQFATRVWKAVTNGQETWTQMLTPRQVRDRIRSVNGGRNHMIFTLQGKPGRLI